MATPYMREGFLHIPDPFGRGPRYIRRLLAIRVHHISNFVFSVETPGGRVPIVCPRQDMAQSWESVVGHLIAIVSAS